MTLERRLALLCGSAVGATVVVLSVVVYAAVEHQLRRQIDDSLRRQARTVQAIGLNARSAVPRVVGEPPARAGLPPGYVQFIPRGGSAVQLRGDPLPVTGADRAVAAGGRRAVLTDRRPDGVHVRVLTFPLEGGGAVQVARSLNGVDGVLGRLRLILVALCAIGTGVAVAAGRLLSRRVMRPVADLTAAAGHIEATGELDRRIGVTGGDELGRLAQRFNAMLDRLGTSQAALAAALEAQQRLIADASHQLRTPVTSLRMNAEVLRDGGDLTGEERAALLDAIVAEAEELGELVTDVIELARDREAATETEDVRLDLLVGEACERARRHAGAVQVRTTLAPCVVEASPSRLGRAVNNLLDNAVAHSPSGGLVEVGVRSGEITVRDHGPGVAPADAPHVFDRFYRGENARGRPGSGLGLAIVRQVAEAHGGTASVEAAQGGGARFRLQLPCSAPAPGGDMLEVPLGGHGPSGR